MESRRMGDLSFWEIVEIALSDGHSGREQAWAALHRRLAPPIAAYYRSFGIGAELADELVQGFMTDVVLGRTYLRRVMNYNSSRPDLHNPAVLFHKPARDYLIDHFRARRREQIGRDRLVENTLRPPEESEIDNAGQRALLQRAMQSALKRVRTHCLSSGLDRHWNAFEERCLHHAVWNTRRTPIKQLARKYGFRRPNDCSAALQHVRRLLKRELDAILREDDGHP